MISMIAAQTATISAITIQAGQRALSIVGYRRSQ
jgi:hypothetical protein